MVKGKDIPLKTKAQILELLASAEYSLFLVRRILRKHEEKKVKRKKLDK